MKGRDMERRYRTLFDACHDGIYLTAPSGHLLEVNPAMLELFGYTREELLGLDSTALFADPGRLGGLERDLDDAGFIRDVEVRLLRKDGRELTCLLTLVKDPARRQPGGNGAGSRPGIQGIIRDITERRHAEERIRHASLHDSLTQLPNRVFLLDRLQRLLERLPFQPDYRFAVLFVDLDRFKLVNDSLGHRAGDELLITVAQRLPNLVRPGDIVARFGGDEFTILLLDIEGIDEARIVAERIQDGLGAEVFHVLGHDVYLSASIGIALGTDDYATAGEIIRDADTAMYAAKEDGSGRWALFDAPLRERTVLRFATETALRQGLERGEFVLRYQPLVAMESGEIVGFEALLRWDHPERGLLLPEKFLSVAEDTGLIIPIGQWVLGEACRVASEWKEDVAEECGPVMSVNLSARQLMHPGLGAQVRSILQATGLPGRCLRLEITETVFLQSSPTVKKTLSELDALDVLLCLDDFGTGYSSLGYLRDLPVDVVKIDRSFVGGIGGVGGTGGGGGVGGVDGVEGTEGAPGPDGADRPDGTLGPDNADGPDGPDGPDGFDRDGRVQGVGRVGGIDGDGGGDERGPAGAGGLGGAGGPGGGGGPGDGRVGSSGAEMTRAILALARELGVAAVAEGVETEDQRDNLIRLGCGFAQGFLFSHPLTAHDARLLLKRKSTARP